MHVFPFFVKYLLAFHKLKEKLKQSLFPEAGIQLPLECDFLLLLDFDLNCSPSISQTDVGCMFFVLFLRNLKSHSFLFDYPFGKREHTLWGKTFFVCETGVTGSLFWVLLSSGRFDPRLPWAALRQQKGGDIGAQRQGQRRHLLPDAVSLTGKTGNQIFSSPCSTVLAEHDINSRKRARWQRGWLAREAPAAGLGAGSGWRRGAGRLGAWEFHQRRGSGWKAPGGGGRGEPRL